MQIIINIVASAAGAVVMLVLLDARPDAWSSLRAFVKAKFKRGARKWN